MIKSSLIYLAGGIFNRAIPFLLLPILTHYLTPDEYGAVALFQVLLFLTIPFVGMNLHNNISRNFTKMSRSEMASLIGTLLVVLFSSMLVVSFLILLWVFFIGYFFGLPRGWLLVLPLVAAFHITNQFHLTVLRNQERPFFFASMEVSNSLLNIAISLILVAGLKFGWEGRAIGIVCSTCCFGGLGLLLLHKQNLLAFRVSGDFVKTVLRISVPLIPHALGGVVITLSDRLFIERLISKEAVGIYVVGYTFGMLVNLFVESFSRAWSPWFYRQMSTQDTNVFLKKQRIVQITYVYFVCIAVLAFAVACLSQFFLPMIVAEEYQSSAEFIVWVAFGYAFRGMYTMVFPYFVFMGKTNFLAVCTIAIALINMTLNYFLICANGAVGAAQATLVSWFLMFVFAWSYSMRIYQMPWLHFRG